MSAILSQILIKTLYIKYMDIMTGERFLQFTLLTWTSFISQIVNPVEREGKEKWSLGSGS